MLALTKISLFLQLSSSCDGTVIVWNMKTKDPKPEHVINVMAAVSAEYVSGSRFTETAVQRMSRERPLTIGAQTSQRCISSPARIPVAWHPTGEFFVIGKDQSKARTLEGTTGTTTLFSDLLTGSNTIFRRCCIP